MKIENALAVAACTSLLFLPGCDGATNPPGNQTVSTASTTAPAQRRAQQRPKNLRPPAQTAIRNPPLNACPAIQVERVTLLQEASIFIQPRELPVPLTTLPGGSVLPVTEVSGDWYLVKFGDQRWGPRIGYVRCTNVSTGASLQRTTFAQTSPPSQPQALATSTSTQMRQAGGTSAAASATRTESSTVNVTPAREAVETHQVRTRNDTPRVNSSNRTSVTVVARQTSETGYSFVVPGYISTRSSTYANCSGTSSGSLDATTYGQTMNGTYNGSINGTYNGSSYTSCSGTGNSTTTVAPAREVSYAVSGATLSLRLLDGRLAVVNCNSKMNWTEWGGMPRRSCRVPTINQFAAEFKGENVKLLWRVGIHGETEKSETYRLVEILEPAR
jgi:hypothetical protein